MTFLNMMLLGGVLAGAIPIIIHIINRNRFRLLPWGAMHLLEQILRTQRRRLRIEQLILLMVRFAIPILLALCMARPVLTGMQALLGDVKTSMLFLVDNSYSMNACPTTHSLFTQAKREVSTIINSLPRGSEVTVEWMTGQESARIGPTFDRSRVRGALSTRHQGFGMADVAAGLERAAMFFSKAHYADRELVIVSDFQRVSWNQDGAQSRRRSLELIQNLPISPRLTMLHVGKQVEDNIAVESLDLSRPIIGAGQSVRVRSDIRNWGKRGFEDLRVFFRVDGENRSVSQITVQAGQNNQVVFSHTFDTPGSHVVEIYADADPLKADNVKRYSIPVWEKLPVLLISGDTNSEPMQSETAYLEIALQPFTFDASGKSDLIRAKVITQDKLNAEELLVHRVVILANVREMSDLQVTLLRDFIRRGGGMLVFAGDRVNSQWYNDKLFAPGRAVLACRFAETVYTSDNQNVTPAGIVGQHYEHPALELFNDPRNGSLQSMRIHSWLKVIVEQSSPDTVTTLAQLDTGDAFLVEKRFGAGRVIQCCTACDDDWSNLPLRPAYLQLMQQLVTYLAAEVYPPRNVEVGQQLAAILHPDAAEKIAVMTDPEGKRHELKAVREENHSLLEFSHTERPGLYVLETPDNDTIHFVVNTSTAESDLRLLGDGEFDQLAHQMQAEAVTSAEGFFDLDRQRRFGREIWKLVLAGVLIFMFLEMFLQQRFARVKQ